ncbi:MAG TPA: pirin family protein [Polyangiaceae bacterium]|nr:pirin family protein [Polyangiaceae bacterium]
MRRSQDRGRANFGWLDSRHSFSFGDYYDPSHMGFRKLRVINDDRVMGGGGFGTHGHRDMEIVTYVLSGALQHEDSMGNGTVMRPGDVQRMSAGTGVMHSEFNASKTEQVHFLQIWILPDRTGTKPSYEQKTFPEAEKQGKLRLVASGDGASGSVSLGTDARLYASVLSPGERVTYEPPKGRHTWIQVARGRVKAGETELAEGDGASTSDGAPIPLETVEAAELVVFDLP